LAAQDDDDWWASKTKLGTKNACYFGQIVRNGVEASTKILVYQSVVEHAEVVRQLEFYGDRSSLPNGAEILAHTAEVLHQVEGADVVSGGWVGGDAWFGSAMTVVEVTERMEVESTWIIKDNHSFNPMAGLHAVLKGIFGNKCAGHWVSMTSVIGCVKLLALAYTWSQKGVSYFLPTCRITHHSSVMYKSSFEDEFGSISSEFFPRPQISHFLYEYLPLIDEHNKQRQSVLGLERKWSTQCCWTRLIVILTGTCVVDMHCKYRCEKRLHNRVIYGLVLEEEPTVIRFSDLIC
jgi:hypothetical protein